MAGVLHDFQCTACDRIFEAVFTVDTDHPIGPPCPTCTGETIRVFLPPSVRWTPDAVVVYQAPDGSFRFPGETGGASCAKYDRLGYTRVEARGFAEVRHLESRMNTHEHSQMMRKQEQIQERRERGESLRRSELRSRMQGMSRLGRDVARAAMARTDAKGRPIVRDAGLHVDAYANDRSNRDDSRRGDGRRFRD